MKKLLLVLSLMAVIICTTACTPVFRYLDLEPSETPIPTLMEQYVEIDGETIVLRTYTAPDGYCFYTTNNQRLGEAMCLGCNDQIENYILKWEGNG